MNVTEIVPYITPEVNTSQIQGVIYVVCSNVFWNHKTKKRLSIGWKPYNEEYIKHNYSFGTFLPIYHWYGGNFICEVARIYVYSDPKIMFNKIENECVSRGLKSIIYGHHFKLTEDNVKLLQDIYRDIYMSQNELSQMT